MAPIDYQTLIDRPTWAFLARNDACYPPNTAHQSIADQRRIYDAMCRHFHRGYPPGITAKDTAIAGVHCRIYAGRQKPCVVYLHGGGYVVGGLHSHDDVCAEICAQTGYQVISAGYRLAPEHQHPAAYLDALDVSQAVATSGPAILVGDSAGGNLAACVAHTLRHSSHPPLGQVLIYPGLGGDSDQGSYLTHAKAPMLTRDDVLYYGGIRHPGGPPPKDDATAFALHDTDFSGLPPTIVFSAECDPLSDDGRNYCARITAAGGRATWHLEPGLVHGYLRARASVPRAATSFAKIITAISTFGATA